MRTHINKKPLYIWSVFNNRCPRCREGKLFQSDNAYDLKNNIKMHERCTVCGQITDIEVGFYYGTSYVSYAVTVALSVATFVAWWVIFGISLEGNSVFYWLAFNAILLIALQPPLMRFSRTLWLSWFVKYDPDWKEKKATEYERVVKEQMKNW
jgi:uncharacterized protein (DUF983 family)